MFSTDAPIIDTTAITATEKLIIVATFNAVLAETPNVVSRVYNNGTSAAPPVITTAAIASTAPTIITTVSTISSQYLYV